MITLEHLLYLLLLGLAAVLRLGNLGAAPLSPEESARALAGWQWLQGESFPLWEEPALASLLGAAFFLLGESDTVARLPSALLGVALVGAMWLWRDLLGRPMALAAAALLALSPSLVLTSRMVSSQVLAASIALILLASLASWFRGRGTHHLYASALLLALLGESGPGGITQFLVLLTAAATWFALGGWEGRLPGTTTGEELFRAGVLWFVAAVVVASGFFRVVAPPFLSGLPAWLARFDPSPTGQGPAGPFALWFVGYEPLILGLGLWEVGYLWRTWRRRELSPHDPRLFLLLWALGNALVWVLTADPFAPEHLFVVLALAFLGAGCLTRLWRRETYYALGRHAPAVAFYTVFLLFGAISINWLTRPEAQLALGPERTQLLVLAGAPALVALGLLWLGSLHPAALGAVFIPLLVAYTLHTDSGLHHGAFAAAPSEAPAPALREALRELQPGPTGQGEPVPPLVVDESLRYPLAWYLRHREGVVFRRAPLRTVPGASHVLTLVSPESPGPRPEYAMMKWLYRAEWPPPGGEPRQLWRWLLLHEAYAQPQWQEIALYTRG